MAAKEHRCKDNAAFDGSVYGPGRGRKWVNNEPHNGNPFATRGGGHYESSDRVVTGHRKRCTVCGKRWTDPI